MSKKTVIHVHPSRLLKTYTPGHRSFTEGDIVKTYSADVISESKRIRCIFEQSGKAYVCTSIYSSGEGIRCCGGTEIFTPQLFKGPVVEGARKPGRFYYYGMDVKRGKEWLFLGETFEFVPDPVADWSGPEEQSLFDF